MVYLNLKNTETTYTINVNANLKTYNSILKRSIRAAKLSYYEQLFNSYKNDASKKNHGKPLTKYYIGQLKKVHYLNISRTDIIK